MKHMDSSSRGEMMLNMPVSRVIPQLAIPTIISMLITSIYNMADTFFVSQLGTSASGAVGVIFSAMAMIQAISFTIGMGSGTNVSQALGAGDEEKAQRYVSTAFFTAVAVGAVLAAHGWTVGNIDATILAERPKLAPYIETMREKIAGALGIETDQVSVKATTEEKLGFTGAGEGIAAHAVCLIETK